MSEKRRGHDEIGVNTNKHKAKPRLQSGYSSSLISQLKVKFGLNDVFEHAIFYPYNIKVVEAKMMTHKEYLSLNEGQKLEKSLNLRLNMYKAF